MLHILKPACSFLGEGPFKKDMQLLRCLIRNITFSLRKIWFLTPQTSHPVLLTHTCLNTWAADFLVKCWNVSLHQQTPRVNMNHAILFHKLPVMGIPSPLNGKLRGCFQVKKSFLSLFLNIRPASDFTFFTGVVDAWEVSYCVCCPSLSVS